MCMCVVFLFFWFSKLSLEILIQRVNYDHFFAEWKWKSNVLPREAHENAEWTIYYYFVNESNNADMHILHFKLNFVKYLLVLKLKMQFQMSFLILIKSKNEQCWRRKWKCRLDDLLLIWFYESNNAATFWKWKGLSANAF